MRLIGVIDLAGGLAVHARGGDRAQYRPVTRVAGHAIDGDPRALARTYVERFGIAELYVADLNAIRSLSAAGPPEIASPAVSPLADPPGHISHDTLLADLATVAPMWLDAGVSTPKRARQVIALGATMVVVGLETLDSFATLAAICDAVGAQRVAFSLDLRDGAPIAPRMAAAGSLSPEQLAARAADAGVGSVIVLDLSRVGVATGPDIAQVGRIRAVTPGLALITGGGIRGTDDLAQLAEAGCDSVLVASALHDGRLTALDVGRIRHPSDKR